MGDALVGTWRKTVRRERRTRLDRQTQVRERILQHNDEPYYRAKVIWLRAGQEEIEILADRKFHTLEDAQAWCHEQVQMGIPLAGPSSIEPDTIPQSA